MSGNKFKLNADKTHFLVMGTSERLQVTEQLSVEMDGVELKESAEKSETLLGVVIQSYLKWSLQMKALTDKMKKRLTGLEKLKTIMNRFNKKNMVQGVFNSVL